MYLLRATLIKFTEIPDDLSILNRTYGDVTLEVGPITEFNREQKMIFLNATIKLPSYPITEDGFLDVPNELRKKCEEVIEKVTRIISLCYGIRREIFSPSPLTVGYFSENSEEFEILKSAKEGLFSHAKIILKGAPPLTEFDWEASFSDREEGVLLMSEALNQSSYSGQFRDFIRLFENALARSTKQMSKKLSQCLNPEMGYTKNEIDRWVNLRDPLSHADQKESSVILYEADVAPVIWRVRQAAYDILLNKKIWNDQSSERRNIWSAGCYSTNDLDEFTIRVGAKNIGFFMTDPYNVYTSMPINIENFPANFFMFKPKNNEKI